MLNTLLLIFVLVVCFTAIYDLKIALCIYIVYIFLVPYMEIHIFDITLGYNIVTTYLTVIYIIKYVYPRKEKFDTIIARPFIFFYLALFVIAFFPRTLPFSFQFSFLRAEFMSVSLVPILFWQLFKTSKDIEFINKAILVCVTIMTLYGLYCFFTSSNPYLTYFSESLDRRDFVNDYNKISRSAFHGRVQSTTPHPMAWSGVIPMFICFIYFIYYKRNAFFIYVFISFLLFSLFSCGTRSGLFAFFTGQLYLLSSISRWKKVAVFCIVSVIFVTGIDTSVFGEYRDYADSIIGIFSDNTELAGSSTFDGRLDQLFAIIDLALRDNIFIGKGHYWTQNFITTYGNTPHYRAFESVFFVALVDDGIVGVAIWISFFIYLMSLNHKMTYIKNLQKERAYIDSLLISYVIFILITGICQTFVMFSLIYTIMLKNVAIKGTNEIQSAMCWYTKQRSPEVKI